jgi:hypothetical protein
MSRWRSFSPPVPVLRVGDPHSFAEYTFRERLPVVLNKVRSQEVWTPEQIAALTRLEDELRSGMVRHIADDGAPDLAAWRAYLEPWRGRSWAELPFFFAEAYFYRRILEATTFFPERRHDPFAPSKRSELRDAVPSCRGAAPSLAEALRLSLWGNRVDLSQLDIAPAVTGPSDEPPLVVDRFEEATPRIARARRLAIVADNAGSELLGDLALADVLLRGPDLERFVLHLKAHPTFVSDATVADADDAIQTLEHDRRPACRALGERLTAALASGRLVLEADPFWNSPLFFWDLPPPLVSQLGAADVVILKGDANYRRLVGDCRWPSDASFADLTAYFPAPVFALRTLKSEVVVGVPAPDGRRLDAERSDWRVSGRFAVAQLGALR